MEAVTQQVARRVLVVEDDRSVIRMLRIALVEAGFEVAQASSGAEALAVLEEACPDAVVLDLGLPDGRGGAVLGWLRQHRQPNGSGPAWVVITALDRQEAAGRYGPLDRHFLAKPFDPWELVRMLNSLLRGAQ